MSEKTEALIATGGTTLLSSDIMLPGHTMWTLHGKPVWAGCIGQPVEDLEYDSMVLHPSDITALKEQADERHT